MTHCHSETDTGLGESWKAPRPVSVNIQTPRLTLRPFELAEAQALFDAISADRSTLAPWVPWAARDHHALHQTVLYIAKQLEALRDPDSAKGLGLGVFDRVTGELLGGHGFHDVRSDTASCEVGYWMRSTRRGQGITTEATAHLLSWLFTRQARGGMGLKRVRIYCSAENAASSKVPTKLGLVEEVRQRRDYFVEGFGPTDRLGWGVLADEWDCDAHTMRA